jgi:phospholipid/cholesterol/gamma-HCH transport system ATP-binding protein
VVHDDVNLEVYRGEVLSIVGGSGSGKTVLLRQIVGLDRPTSGTIRVFGENPAELTAGQLQALRSRWGLQFQRGALFSALSVIDNIALPLREMRALPDDLICRASLLKLQLVGLSAKDADKMPSDLSGGMIKRVGLARALALEPELVFLDEPTAGLDPMASDDYVALIRELRRELGLTVVMITHDLDTLVALSDRVAVLADHKVLAAAPIPEVIQVDHPFIREYFLGERAQRALQALPAPKGSGAADAHPGEA